MENRLKYRLLAPLLVLAFVVSGTPARANPCVKDALGRLARAAGSGAEPLPLLPIEGSTLTVLFGERYPKEYNKYADILIERSFENTALHYQRANPDRLPTLEEARRILSIGMEEVRPNSAYVIARDSRIDLGQIWDISEDFPPHPNVYTQSDLVAQSQVVVSDMNDHHVTLPYQRVCSLEAEVPEIEITRTYRVPNLPELSMEAHYVQTVQTAIELANRSGQEHARVVALILSGDDMENYFTKKWGFRRSARAPNGVVTLKDGSSGVLLETSIPRLRRFQDMNSGKFLNSYLRAREKAARLGRPLSELGSVKPMLNDDLFNLVTSDSIPGAGGSERIRIVSEIYSDTSKTRLVAVRETRESVDAPFDNVEESTVSASYRIERGLGKVKGLEDLVLSLDAELPSGIRTENEIHIPVFSGTVVVRQRVARRYVAGGNSEWIYHPPELKLIPGKFRGRHFIHRSKNEVIETTEVPVVRKLLLPNLVKPPRGTATSPDRLTWNGNPVDKVTLRLGELAFELPHPIQTGFFCRRAFAYHIETLERQLGYLSSWFRLRTSGSPPSIAMKHVQLIRKNFDAQVDFEEALRLLNVSKAQAPGRSGK